MDKVLQYFVNFDGILWYNVICFIRMMVAYLVVCIVIPAFCFKRYLPGKSFFFRIVFYQVIANIYINLLGFILAYLGLFCYFSVFTGVVLIPIIIKLIVDREVVAAKYFQMGSEIKSILIGTYGIKQVIKDSKTYVLHNCKKIYSKTIKGHKIELTVVVITILYAVLFWGFFRFFNPAYGHTDEETHLYWIRSIVENNAFVTGLYPYGMHFLIAMLTTVFVIPADAGTLVMSIVTMSIAFTMIYIVARMVFKSRYAALFGWSFLIITGMFTVRAYYRFEYIFPMEFSMIAMLMGVFALICTIKYKDKLSFLLFAMTIAWSLYAHFYGTIILALICIIFGITHFIVIIKSATLKKYIVSGIIGLLLGILPFCVGLLCGYEFERSIDWALGVFSEDEELINSGLATVVDVEEEETEMIETWEDVFYQLGDNAFATEDYAKIAVVLWGVVFVYGLLGSIFYKKSRYRYLMYLMFALIWLVLAVMSIASSLGIPCLLHENRAAGFLVVCSCVIFAMPLQICMDALCFLCRGKKYAWTEYLIIALGVIGIAYVFYIGEEKEDLYFETIVSDADGRLFLELLQEEESNTWTVITTTNMLSMIKGDGYHVEILEILEKSEEGESIYVPTEKIFVVIEKNVLSYSESLISIEENGGVTYGGSISVEEALDDDTDIYNAYGDSPDRAYYFNRETIMSRLYYWALKLEETYPSEVSVYYEDDDTIIYLIQQDPYFLLNLSVDYMADLEENADEY